MGYAVSNTSGYRSAERVSVFLPTSRVSDIPVVFAHGGGGTWAQWMDTGPNYLPADCARRGLVGLASDLGGGAPWGSDDMVAASTGAIDQLVAWSATNHGTRIDQVAIVGLSHGSSALNWAWRQPDRLAAFAHVIPGVNFEAIHTRNPLGATAAMNAAYGGEAGFLAALPTRDPSATGPIAAQRPIADRMAVWYGLDDTVTLPAEVAAWAAAVRIPADQRHPMAGVGHDFDFDWDPIVDWLFSKIFYPHN